jgi:hypothetical protein
MRSHLPSLIMIALISYILMAPIGQVISTNNANAQLGPLGQLNQSAVIFRNVAVDPNLGPNKPFKVNATISVSDMLPRHILLSLSVPKEISISGPAISDLGDMSSRDGQRTSSWTLIASASGSLPLNITAYSSSISISNINNNYQSTSFPFDVSIGSPIVSSIRPFQILLAGSELTSSVIGPGDKNLPLNITLANDGTLPLYSATATLELSEPFYWSYIQNSTKSVETHTESFDSGRVATGQNIIAPYFLNVRKSATPDTYMNHLRVSFFDGKQQHQMIYNIPISVSPNTALMVVAKPAKLNPGYYTPVTFDIVNKGNVPLHAIQILSSSSATSSTSSPTNGPSSVNTRGSTSVTTTTSSSPVGPYLSIDTPYWIGDLGVNTNKTLVLKVYTPNEKVTQQPLPITIGYEANGKHAAETFMIGVQINGLPSFQIQTVRVSPPLAYPGNVGTRMDIGILNAGYVIANNVSAQIVKLPRGLTPAWGNATSQYFGRIIPNQNFTASFFLNINNDVTSAGYPLSVLFKFNNKYSQTLYTNFLVSPKAQFSLVGVDGNGLYPGATNVPLRVTLKNTGTAVAQTLTTKFLGGNAVPGVKSTTQTSVGDIENIGDIPAGQVFTTTFIINADPSTTVPGQQVASVDLSWTQTETTSAAQTNTFSQIIPITYHVSQGPSYLLYYYGIPWTYLALAVIIAILVVIFVIKRNRKVRKIDMYLQDSSNLLQTPRPPPSIVESIGNGELNSTKTENNKGKMPV